MEHRRAHQRRVATGTYTLKNDRGAWEGACSGGSRNEGNSGRLACWLVGSAAYSGCTYHIQLTGEGSGANFEGIIYAGSPPKP